MAYDDEITRDAAGALMPEDFAREILGEVAAESVVMTFGRRLPDMSRKTRRLPVWNTLPTAYFVNGDRGRKQTSAASWDNVFLEAEEIAVIVPIPDAVADDADYDIFGEAKPAIVSAIGKAFDQAVLYGIGAPASWPDSITSGAESHGHVVTRGDIGDLYDDLMGEGGVLSLIEEDGFMPSGHVAALRMKAMMRSLREKDVDGNATGDPIFVSGKMSDGASSYMLDGETLSFPRNGAMDPARSLLISGDWSQLVWAVRQDITYKILTEAVITDNSSPPEIIFNLAQDDMSALRVVFRCGWALPNPINLVNSDSFTRYPFATLEPVNAS